MSVSGNIEKIFERLAPLQLETLISLPYRAGVYVSYSDISGGWDAQEKELQALTGILRAYSEDFCKEGLPQKVLMDCLCARDRWPAWSQDIEELPVQAAESIRLMGAHFPPDELEQFKEVLIEIALAVAMAFRESTPDAENAPGTSAFTDMLRRIMHRPPAEDPLGHENISAGEKVALHALCGALSYTGFKKD